MEPCHSTRFFVWSDYNDWKIINNTLLFLWIFTLFSRSFLWRLALCAHKQPHAHFLYGFTYINVICMQNALVDLLNGNCGVLIMNCWVINRDTLFLLPTFCLYLHTSMAKVLSTYGITKPLSGISHDGVMGQLWQECGRGVVVVVYCKKGIIEKRDL